VVEKQSPLKAAEIGVTMGEAHHGRAWRVRLVRVCVGFLWGTVKNASDVVRNVSAGGPRR